MPTVILTSLDDPFAPGGDVLGCPLSPAVHLHAEPTGGHMGYLSRNLPGQPLAGLRAGALPAGIEKPARLGIVHE